MTTPTNTSTKRRRKTKADAAPASVAAVVDPVGPRAVTRVREDTWPIERLRPYDRNAKKHDQAQIDQIRASLRQFG